jgi:hypothetical protein
MNLPPDVKPLPAAVVTWPEVPAPLDDDSAMADVPSKHNAPFLDADINDMVPGYSDSDSWYEP